MRPDKDYNELKSEYRRLIGLKLKAARRHAGLTQKEVWEMLRDDYGYNARKSLISSYERGRRMPPLDVFAKLSEIYGVDPKDLLHNVKSENKSTAGLL